MINNRAEEQDSRRETQRRGHTRQPQIERDKSTEGHREKQRDGKSEKQDEGGGLRSRDKKAQGKGQRWRKQAKTGGRTKVKMTRTGSGTKGWRRKEQRRAAA